MNDAIRERQAGEALIIKKPHYMVVMRSVFGAQGRWFAEDPALPGLESRGLTAH